MYDSGTRLAAEVSSDVTAFFDGAKDSGSIAHGARAFETKIRRNIRLAEAPSFGQSILTYAPSSNGAEDYRHFAEEVLASAAKESAPLRRAA